jgi:hypothetical protein
MDTSASPLLYYNMKKEADLPRTYDSCPVSFMNKNDRAAAGFYFIFSKEGFDVHSAECRSGAGRLEMIPSPNTNAGSSLACSSKGTLPETFLSVLKPCRLWL